MQATRSCCIRSLTGDGEWHEFPGAPATTNVELMELLRDVPEFIGMTEPEAPAVRAVYPAPQSISGRVLVAVDEAAGIRLVGCPDLSDEGGLAAMVSDLLGASGRLWNQPAATIADQYEEATGDPLADTVRRMGSSLSTEQFMQGLARSLREGKFPVMVLVESRTAAVDDTLAYLEGMNLNITLLGYDFSTVSGIDVIRPVALSQPTPRPAAPSPQPAPAPDTLPLLRVPAGPAPAPAATGGYEPFPKEGTSPKQQAIIERLVYLDDLGLERRGFSYFAPGGARRPEAEGSIVITYEKSRWPFPSEEEVIVVIRTASDHFSGFVGMKPQEVEDFLRSLPREERKERKGAMLLRAGNVFEANQLVSELKALLDIARTTRAG